MFVWVCSEGQQISSLELTVDILVETSSVPGSTEPMSETLFFALISGKKKRAESGMMLSIRKNIEPRWKALLYTKDYC